MASLEYNSISYELSSSNLCRPADTEDAPVEGAYQAMVRRADSYISLQRRHFSLK